MQMQNVTYTFPAGAEICTFGFRVTRQWLVLNFGTGRAPHVESTLCRLSGDTDGPFMADFSLHSALSGPIPTCGGS